MNRPLVGTALLLQYEDKFLVAKRLGKHEGQVYGCVGGKVEGDESPTEAILRELDEEAGVKCVHLKPLPFIASCVYPKEEVHYICIWYHAYLSSKYKPTDVRTELKKNGDPKTEPWIWLTKEELKKVPLMMSTLKALDYIGESATLEHFVR